MHTCGGQRAKARAPWKKASSSNVSARNDEASGPTMNGGSAGGEKRVGRGGCAFSNNNINHIPTRVQAGKAVPGVSENADAARAHAPRTHTGTRTVLQETFPEGVVGDYLERPKYHEHAQAGRRTHPKQGTNQLDHHLRGPRHPTAASAVRLLTGRLVMAHGSSSSSNSSAAAHRGKRERTHLPGPGLHEAKGKHGCHLATRGPQ